MWQRNVHIFCLMMASLFHLSISAATYDVPENTKTGKATTDSSKKESTNSPSKAANSTSKMSKEEREEKEINTGPGGTAELSQQGYAEIVQLKSNKEMEKFVKRLVKNMSLVVIAEGGVEGCVPFYSGVKAKQSFIKLREEIDRNKDNVCEGWVAATEPNHEWTGFTAPLNEEGYIAIARKHNDSHMEKFIERTIVDLNYEITDVSGLLGLSPFHSCAKGTKHFIDLQKELMTLGSRPGQWLRLKGSTASAKQAAGPRPHSADKTLQREEYEKKMKLKKEAYNAKMAEEKERKEAMKKSMKTMDEIKANSGKQTADKASEETEEPAKASEQPQKTKVSLLQQEQKMQREALMMKAAREAYDKKVEQEQKMQREMLMMKAAREAYDKKVEEEQRTMKSL